MSQAPRRIMLIAGEASGDRIASRVVRCARSLASAKDRSIEFFGIGGDECAAEGVECFHTVREMSVVGIVEVARRFSFFRRVFHEMVALLDERKPDALLLIDYPGFNIRLAREARKRGIRVIYYVSPQVWAWHASRVKELREVVNEMFVIFPFEEKIYRDAGLAESHFIGHPLVERIDEERARFGSREAFAASHGLDATRPWLLVFAGSRSEEVRRLLPVMSLAAQSFSLQHDFQAILVESTSIAAEHYSEYLRVPLKRLRLPEGSHELMHHSSLGILKSGTTTLEAALLGLPGVICYRTHPFTFILGKRLVKLPYIGLANIVLGAKLYPELLQDELTEKQIVDALEEIDSRRTDFREALEGLSSKLRVVSPSPSERVAQSLLS